MDCKIAFLTLGCKLNYAETSTYSRALAAAGFEAVPWRQKADAYLVNTCSVTATSDAKSRNLVRKVHRLNPDAVIVVTGCGAQLRADDFAAIPGVTKVFGCAEKNLVSPYLTGLFSGSGAVSVPHDIPQDIFPAYSSGERTRSFLKVQDGCNNCCKYCTVPYARGESRSVPICLCVRQAGEIAAQGIREIVLTGVNTGDYGRGGESFLDLLKALNEVPGIERYRISSIEPNLLTEETVDWIASGTKFQPHFHIPLQVGTDELLQKMGRRYDTALFRQKIEYVRSRMDRDGCEVFFGIDVMAGLPGETEELFERSLEFIRSIRPAFIHVFPYSRRPGTPAAGFPGQVSDEEKKDRVARLERLCAELHDSFVLRHKGRKARVLFESKEKGGLMSGYTGNYIKVTRDYDASLVGRTVEVEI
ncbi:MAG: tRNA (N(6)-L-threonylcarbamoyladenosine(37)-C(2))-methylthiotransferase MtaB [Bacteroidales bacterium]|nr:tRNA (N(6)-L-threonylcarbamoyladenosine(37)-C(2))-methylthiotransferase MtaB [Bacteroidales bacterium]